MTPLPIPVSWALAALVVAAAFSDVRSRTIPNWLTLGGILAGFAVNYFASGVPGLKTAGLGFLASVLFLIPFMLGFLGGGDVKLMAAVGTFAGAGNLLVIFVLEAILGGVVALIGVIARGRVRRTFFNIGRIIRLLAQGKAPYTESPELEAGNEASFGMPRAVTIATATLLFIWGSRP
jgi:prepilin peptidase CpaA